MRRPTAFGWLLILAGLTTVVLALVAPAAALVAGVIFALLLLTLLAEGTTSDLPLGSFDPKAFDERKRDALSRRLKRGRPEWETTAPDHADEPADAIWQRERERRGLR